MDEFALTISVSSETLLDQLPAATWTVDPDLRLTSWNGGGLVPPGAAPDIRPGQSVTAILHAYGIDSAALAAHTRTLQGATTSLSVRGAAGREFKVSLSPLRGSRDHVIGVVGVAVEVTDEARANESTRREAAFRRALSTFFGHTVRHKVDAAFYQQVLAAALDMVPGTQAGSFWRRNDDGNYQAMAALGFELAALEGVTLTAAELSRAEPGHDTRLASRVQQETSDPAPRQRRPPAPVGVVRATLSVPVMLHDEAVAYLYLHSFDRGDAFDAQAHEFVQLFANELAALFNHVQLQETLREQRSRLERFVTEYKALAEFSAEIETIHDTDELVEYGTERLLRAFEFDTAMFTEVRDGAVHFERLRGRTTEELIRTLRTPQPLGAGVSGRVAVTGEALYVDDYPTWEARHEPYLPTGVQSILALPVRKHGQVLHTLAFATLNRRAALDENAVRIAGAFVKRLENAFERTQHLDEIKATREATFRSLGVALEYRDLETRGHTDRVVNLSRSFATAVGLDPEQRRALAWGAYLHDIGKVAVPDAILLKPGKLTTEEYDVIRKHTLFGVEMLRDMAFLPADTVAVVRSHHERWDGSGYPDGLAGESIPLLARMFSLVDVYDALTSERPYKPAWTHADAVAELQKQAGAQFDPRLVPLFLAALAETAA